MQVRIYDLLRALQYDVSERGTKLAFFDPSSAFPNEKVVLCGRIRDLTESEYLDEELDFLVTEDGARDDSVRSLMAAARPKGASFRIETETRFIDRLWRAELAIGAIEDDAHAVAMQIPADNRKIDVTVKAWYERHIGRELISDKGSVHAAVFFDKWLQDKESSVPIIYADAGAGKTELAAYIARRSSINYTNSTKRQNRQPLPPLLFRIPLGEISSLSLGGIAAYLDKEINTVRLNGPAIHYLLTNRRIALLLDGLDELRIPIDMLHQGLHEIGTLVMEGAKISLTSRSISAFQPDTSLIQRGLYGVATPFEFVGLTSSQAVQFLESYDVPRDRALGVVEVLPESFATNPLFLLLGEAANVAEAFDTRITTARRTELMDLLLRKFCEREYVRQRIPVEEQLHVLSWIAYTSSKNQVAFTRAQLVAELENSEKKIVTYPHGFLMASTNHDGSEEIRFRNDLVRRFLIAQELYRNVVDHIEQGSDAVAKFLSSDFHLSRKALASQTLELLAEMFSESDLRAVSVVASKQQIRSQRYLARNLLYIALQILKRSGLGQSTERADYLAALISTKDLSGTTLTGLVFDNLDFDGWSFKRTTAQGTQFVGCRLLNSETDETSLLGAQYEACDRPAISPGKQREMEAGFERLLEIAEMFQVEDGAPALKQSVNVRDIDRSIMEILSTHGYAVRTTESGGNRVWTMSRRGRQAFGGLVLGGSPDPQLEPLLMDLGGLG